MNKKKKIIIAVVIVALIAAIVGIYFGTRPKADEGGKTITVEVVHADASEKTFTYSTNEEYVGPVLENAGLVKGETTEYGLYITSVDGEEADYDATGAYWAFYINGEYAMTGVDATPVNDGDVYRLAYEVYVG